MELNLNKKWNAYKRIEATLFVIYILVSIKYAAKQSFWYDEMATISFIRTGFTLKDVLYQYLTVEVTNLPLYAIVLYPIYKIAPYGEIWILLPSIISPIIGIWILGKLGKIFFDEEFEFLIICITTISSALMYHCAFELRAYAFLFMFSSLSLFLFIQKMKNCNLKNTVLFGISIVLLLYTHYFGAVTVLLYGVVEFILVLRRKHRYTSLVSYFIGFICFVPWFIMAMRMKKVKISEFWPLIPSLEKVKNTIVYLLGNDKILYFFFVVGCVYIVIMFFNEKNDFLIKVLCVNVFIVITEFFIIYVYSAFMNPKGSIFVERYFFAVMPQMYVIITYTFYCLTEYISVMGKGTRKIYFLIIGISIIGYCGTNSFLDLQNKVLNNNVPYRELAEWVNDNKETFNEKDIILITTLQMGEDGWKDYYFRKRNFKVPGNVCCTSSKSDEEILQRISLSRDIYFFKVDYDVTDNVKRYIDENYKIVDQNEYIHMIHYEKK